MREYGYVLVVGGRVEVVSRSERAHQDWILDEWDSRPVTRELFRRCRKLQVWPSDARKVGEVWDV